MRHQALGVRNSGQKVNTPTVPFIDGEVEGGNLDRRVRGISYSEKVGNDNDSVSNDDCEGSGIKGGDVMW